MWMYDYWPHKHNIINSAAILQYIVVVKYVYDADSLVYYTGKIIMGYCSPSDSKHRFFLVKFLEQYDGILFRAFCCD